MAQVLKKQRNKVTSNNMQVKEFNALTASQQLFFDNYAEGKHQVLLGYSGTGKTFMAMLKAFEDLEKGGEYKKIVIVRSAVPTRDIGFLKGSEAEKGAVYEIPYKSICCDLFGRGDAYEVLSKHGSIQFMLTSFIRGITLDNCIIIVDELQNLTAHEADSVLTRLGKHSKIIMCGDILQRDFTKFSEKNIESFMKIIERMDCFDINFFGENDVVRSGVVGEYIRKKHKLFPKGFE